ncbi:hypothetical protein N7481_011304 [Penicillium waksmanii]|uniref:uncharacterized protein n=1 Tax=Penicillium waksmanii TaxID=69791 RepID=UPI0025495C33|nr:uncharacterized protein N7481_011304 [Penicillium waksmanii]KAJ5974094.1 hypothetical protein N7481_011304 [Penicillium waksmanii]
MSLNGLCPTPFLQESLFPSTGGFTDGRYCETLQNVTCCLPCPLADWRYADNTAKRVDVASWISVAILPLCVFLLVSYAVLPVKWTNRHYLSICFTLGICCMEIAFIIPLGAKPKQCYNEITPNDMYTDLSCAFSGAFLLFGGWLVYAGNSYSAQNSCGGAFLCGFGIPAIGLTVMMIVTGVSFRFGEICHINIKHGQQDYWFPLIAFSAAALILQLATMAYCMHIYLRSLFDKSASTTDNSSGIPSYTSSVRTQTARQAYRRVKRVVQLQWRGVALVLIIIGNVIFFAVVFLDLDREVEPTPANMKKALPWLMCLMETGGNKNKCINYASSLGPNEATLLAVVYLLSLVGFWNFILYVRPTMFSGWLDLCRRGFTRRNDFVSADADRYDSKGFEMLTTTSVKGPDNSYQSYNMRSPSPAHMMGYGHGHGHTRSSVTSPAFDRHDGDQDQDHDRNVHFGQEARYVRPSMSFSGPRPPSESAGGRDWDPSTTFARGYAR